MEQQLDPQITQTWTEFESGTLENGLWFGQDDHVTQHIRSTEICFLTSKIASLPKNQQRLKTLVFKNVSFSNTEETKEALHNLFELPQLRKIALCLLARRIVGPTTVFEVCEPSLAPLIQSLQGTNSEEEEEGEKKTPLIDTLHLFRVLFRGKETGSLVGSARIGSVRFVSCSFDVEFMKGMASVRRHAPETLRFCYCSLSNEMMAALAGDPDNNNLWEPNSLRSLDVYRNRQLTAGVLPHVAQLLRKHSSSLETLQLSRLRGLFSGDDGLPSPNWTPFAVALAGAQALQELNFSTFAMNVNFIKELVGLGSLPSLKKLSLEKTNLFHLFDNNNNKDSLERVQAFCAWISTTLRLEHLNLSSCLINDTAAIVVPLFRALERNSTIQVLKLRGAEYSNDNNRITICGWEQSLSRLTHLRELSIGWVATPDKDCLQTFEAALAGNTSLTVLSVVSLSFQDDDSATPLRTIQLRYPSITQRNLGICRAQQALDNNTNTSVICAQYHLWPATIKHLLQTTTNLSPSYDNASAAFEFLRGMVINGQLSLCTEA